MVVGSAQGREKRFPMYHGLLTARSSFLRSARTAQPQQPVRLDDEDPEVFSLYLNCVHSGIEVVRSGGELLGKQVDPAPGGVAKLVKRERENEQGADENDDHPDGGRFEALIRLHLLASKLYAKCLLSITCGRESSFNGDQCCPLKTSAVLSIVDVQSSLIQRLTMLRVGSWTVAYSALGECVISLQYGARSKSRTGRLHPWASQGLFAWYPR